MSILSQVVGVAAFAIATTSFTASFIFMGLCKKVETLWKGDLPQEAEARLDRRRVRYAMISLSGAVTAAFLALILKNALGGSQMLNITLWCIVAASILLTLTRVVLHNRRGELVPFVWRRRRRQT